MDDKQLLDAIRGIVREEARIIVGEEIAANNDVLLRQTAEMMDEKIAANNDVLLHRMDEKIAAGNEATLQKAYAYVDGIIAANNEVLLRGVKTIVENKYDEVLKLLQEDYTPLASTVYSTAQKIADYADLKQMLRSHERALQTHKRELDMLKKQAIG